MADTVALCHIEHKGVEYNYGDIVPQEVVDAHPTAVGPAPLTDKHIESLTKDELKVELRRLAGLNGDTEATPVEDEDA